MDAGPTRGPARRRSGRCGAAAATRPSDRAAGALWRAVPYARRAWLRSACARTSRTAPWRSGLWGPVRRGCSTTLPDLLGADDDSWTTGRPRRGSTTSRRAVRVALAPGWRVPRTRRVWESLVPTVLEQKVTGQEARFAWRRLVRAYGTPAPGPAGACLPGLTVAARSRDVGTDPVMGVAPGRRRPGRSRTLVSAAPRAAALERTLALPFVAADAALRSLPGVGVWTSAEVRQRAYGDPDAVSVGDAHVAAQVVYALTGSMDGDDDQMLELLAAVGRPSPSGRPDDRARGRRPPPPGSPLRRPRPPHALAAHPLITLPKWTSRRGGVTRRGRARPRG